MSRCHAFETSPRGVAAVCLKDRITFISHHQLGLRPRRAERRQRSSTPLLSSAMATQPSQAVASGDLTDMVSSSTSATVYPSDDTILSVLQARFRSDLPYARVGASNLVVINPYKTLANVNDASAKEYEERCYKDTSLPLPGGPPPLAPHPFELAARVYLLMRRRNESQAVIFR